MYCASLLGKPGGGGSGAAGEFGRERGGFIAAILQALFHPSDLLPLFLAPRSLKRLLPWLLQQQQQLFLSSAMQSLAYLSKEKRQ